METQQPVLPLWWGGEAQEGRRVHLLQKFLAWLHPGTPTILSRFTISSFLMSTSLFSWAPPSATSGLHSTSKNKWSPSFLLDQTGVLAGFCSPRPCHKPIATPTVGLVRPGFCVHATQRLGKGWSLKEGWGAVIQRMERNAGQVIPTDACYNVFLGFIFSTLIFPKKGWSKAGFGKADVQKPSP